MFDYPKLPASLRDRVMHYLGCPPSKPGPHAVNELLSAYIQKVPWESVFRIAKRGRTPLLEECPRWPEEFWLDAIERGGGGTCFESNYAFLALLRSLGYEGYLTINNMGDRLGCHTAVILLLHGQKRLVDVGIPLHKSLLLRNDQTTRTPAYFHTYIIRPTLVDSYEIERTNHPKRNIYTLVDQPIPDDAYRLAAMHDYGRQGYFLDQVIINKVIDGKIWRFNSSDRPLQLEAFDRRNKIEVLLPETLLARRLATYFGMERKVIQAALDQIGL
ncbi:MAG: arylamine N-acetyltransferase [Caldilineaceae bacterium]|nr:arylamine N-acetyltransferase [Caldilineaceae bacterium]